MLKNIDRRLLTILLIIFVQMIGASMILPILPLYAESKFSMSPRTITLLNTTFFGAQLLAGPSIGRLSDRYGRVPVLIISQIGTVISFLMLAFAPSVAWLFAARLLDGVTGGNIIVARAYVVDITAPEKRTQALAYISAAFGAGFIIGPAMGGLLSGLFGIQVPYVIAAIAAGITVVITWRILDESLSAETRQQNTRQRRGGFTLSMVLQNSVLTKVLLVAFLSQFALGALQSIFSLYTAKVMLSEYSDKATQMAIGLMLAFFGLSQVATQMALVPRL
ncbi:MAG TPA: MFS transporter, partial [Anaerolineae bacterium]|nr:MFS transporter [Anaerolineae bacterium]